MAYEAALAGGVGLAREAGLGWEAVAWRLPGPTTDSRLREGEEVTRYCSEVLTSQHGYLSNPGYPHYYPGDLNCSWHIRVDEGQRLRIRVHDLSVRGVRQGTAGCTDFLRVAEGRRLLSLDCGDLERPLVLTSRGPEVTVTLWGEGQPLYPHRGTLVQYTAVGCPSPSPPRDGYSVHRNATHAHFSCCVNFVFADTLKKDRLLRCVDGHGWNDSLPRQCIDVRILMEFANATVRRILEQNLVTPRPEVRPVLQRGGSMFVDTILPSIIMVVLILGNCVIVAIIMKYRKRDRPTPPSRELVDLSEPDPDSV
ncbi:cubilin-like [Pollicipes pollicipes]|uniref:cubilin-like n=1 Tax=Pollicipes pollicipes TaxID=41117 RepID=UPI0018854372|nr:cubilin-like [Pollicipes pollicipes]